MRYLERTKNIIRKMPSIIARIATNRNIILILAVVLGLVFGKRGGEVGEPLVIPLLALLMTLSTMSITSRELLSLKRLPGRAIISILLNYLVLGGTILVLAWWLIDEENLWKGFVILAIVPPATAVIPFSYTMGGESLFSTIGLIATYLAGLIIVPLMLLLFFGIGSFDEVTLMITLGELIIMPILISRLLRIKDFHRRLEKWRGVIIDWSLFGVIFTLVGLNRQAFFGEFNLLVRMGFIAVAASFALGHMIEFIGRILRFNRSAVISAMLLGTLKNYSLAGGLALSLFTDKAAIPASICVVFGVFFVAWLGFYLKVGYKQTK
jgi:BASS family bile acid:Na+ symporter